MSNVLSKLTSEKKNANCELIEWRKTLRHRMNTEEKKKSPGPAPFAFICLEGGDGGGRTGGWLAEMDGGAMFSAKCVCMS